MILSKMSQALMPKGWSPDQLTDLRGKYYAITGGNSGIGLEAAAILAGKGADVTILCRDPSKAKVALATLAQRQLAGVVDFVPLDLASLASVHKAARTLRKRSKGIAGLLNNAGLMALPTRETTQDGFEMQLGVNHLGHFALAGLLCDLVENVGGRFVIVSSLAHKTGRLRFSDLQAERSYSSWREYGQSKLANLMFALELDRRLRRAGWSALAVACHPGFSSTNLLTTGPGKLESLTMTWASQVFAQPAELGAWPEVMAAASSDVLPGGYYGPTAPGEAFGPVGKSRVAAHARDVEKATKLWTVSEELTGVAWTI